jgi:hypothetical protein
MRRPLLTLLVLVIAGLAPAACSLRRGAHGPPLPATATAALAEARTLVRERPEGWRAAAEAALTRAEAAAPDWIAPRRVRDDLLRQELLGHEALALRRGEVDAQASAADLYLAARLEGRAGFARLEQAAHLDPGFAWGQHGLAWQHFLSGEPRAALRAGRRATELARGSYELATFASSEARYRLSLGANEAAVEGLESALADERLEEPERTELEVVLARAELESFDLELAERGFWRAEALLRADRLSAEEYEDLGASLLERRSMAGLSGTLDLLLAALEQGRSPERDRLRARLWIERGAPALGAALLAPEERESGPFTRARALERGAAAAALAEWSAALPARLKDEHGLPREPALAALVRSADASGTAPGAVAFGAALLAAGWFEEAESWALCLARRADVEPDAALALAGRAAAGQAVMAGIRGWLDKVDGERSGTGPAGAAHGAGAAPQETHGLETHAVETLDELLSAMQPFFEHYRGAPLAQALVDSPRLSYGGLASIVHPGPRFSALDAEERRGAEGEPVPGLAAELANLGRFGIFGQAPGGGGPDGAVLRLVGGEWVEGEHLGVRYAGYVAWCEGADIESRPGRAGSSVSGAALHEGYWIDLEGVRADWRRLRAAETRFLGGGGEERALLERALAGRGPRVPSQAGPDERARWLAPLGEGERVLLAALRERPEPPAGGTRLAFDEVLALTALHEEGHLTDRTRFLPLARHWPKALGLLLRSGFSPRAMARTLEYRAQLVALCEAEEPRLVLAECLAAADVEGGVLTHGEAYRELGEDFLREAARVRSELSALDDEHYLLYQLHLLSAADVRRVARALAERQGMLEE